MSPLWTILEPAWLHALLSLSCVGIVPAAVILLHLSKLAVSPVQAGIHLPIEDAPGCSSAEVSSIHLSALAQGIDPATHAQPGAWQQNDLFD